MHIVAYLPEEVRIAPSDPASFTSSQLVIAFLCLCAVGAALSFWKIPDYGKGEVDHPWYQKLASSIIILLIFGALIYIVNWLLG